MHGVKSISVAVLPLFCLIADILILIGSFFYEGGMKKVEKVRLSVEK